MNAFLGTVVQPVRESGRLFFRCAICNSTMRTEEAACEHAAERHEEQLHFFLGLMAERRAFLEGHGS